MNHLQVFKYGSKDIRTVMVNDEPWWVAKDLAEILGYTTLQRMYDHVDGEDRVEINPQSVKYQGLCENPNTFRLLVINESGLYSAIFGSVLPEAKAFKRWITHEVLPSIRKTGSYSAHQVTMDDCFKAADLISKTPNSKLQYVLKILNNHFDLGDLQRMKVNNCRSDEFSKRLAALMKEKGISQRELAQMSGVCKSAISQYCNGVHKPRADNLQMLAEALNVSVYILVEAK